MGGSTTYHGTLADQEFVQRRVNIHIRLQNTAKMSHLSLSTILDEVHISRFTGASCVQIARKQLQAKLWSEVPANPSVWQLMEKLVHDDFISHGKVMEKIFPLLSESVLNKEDPLLKEQALPNLNFWTNKSDIQFISIENVLWLSKHGVQAETNALRESSGKVTTYRNTSLVLQ